MKKQNLFIYLLIFFANLILGGIFSFAEEFQVPSLRAPVQDEAQIFSSQVISKISALVSDVRAKGGPQIQILSLPNLQGIQIEEAAIKIVENWKLGEKEKDNGVLILVSKEERKIRIEVGQGLEGDLPDVVAKRISSRVITPFFKSGNMDQGLVEGVIAILSYTFPQYLKDRDLGGVDKAEPQENRKHVSGLLIFGLFILLSLLRLFMGGGGGGYSSRGGFFGGGSFGGGSSSGGWSGGGGGFSGGGASGDW